MVDKFSIAFYIGSYGVRWYSIFIFIAFVSSYIAVVINAKVNKIPLKHVENFIFVLFPVSIVSARIWYILGDLSQFSNKPFWNLFDISQGGIAIEGGIVGGIIAGYFWFKHASKITGISLWTYADVIMPNVLLGQAIGRWGNFFNQEILGPETTSGLAFILPHFIRDHLHLVTDPDSIVREPLFLYESFFCVIGWISLLVVLPQIKKHYLLKKKIEIYPIGIIFFSYFVYYGTLRTIIEPFRYGDFIMKMGNIPISILLSAIFIIVGISGISYLVYKKIEAKKEKTLFENGNKLN